MRSSDTAPSAACNKIAGDSRIGQLNRSGLSFAIYAETLPGGGSLVSARPGGLQGAVYAQKHNPVPNFGSLAKTPAALAQVKPHVALAGDLAATAPSMA